MKSQFSGVDPHIQSQRQEPDFHNAVTTYLRDLIVEQLPLDYIARIGERADLIDLSQGAGQIARPDIGLHAGEPSRGQVS